MLGTGGVPRESHILNIVVLAVAATVSSLVFAGRSESGSRVNVEEAVLGSPSLIIRTISVDLKQH